MKLLYEFLEKSIAEKLITYLLPKGNNKSRTARLLSGYSWLIIALGVSLISSLGFFVQQQINYDYDRTIEETSQGTMNLAKAFEEHVRRIITEADKDLLSLTTAHERYGLSSPVFGAYFQKAAEDQSRNQVAVYNEQGDVIESSNWNAREVDCAAREYFLTHQYADSQILYIGKPIMGKIIGENTIPLTRRINKRDGSFGGIVYIGIRSDYFSDFYQKIDLGKDSTIAIVGLDGFIRDRQADGKVGGGEDIRNSEFWINVQAGRPYSTSSRTSVLDGINRIGSYRVMPDYPIIVVVEKSSQVALAGYEQRRRGYIFGTLLASLFILFFCGLLLNRAAKQRALHTEMTAILESISDPFIVLDKGERLTYINKEAVRAVDIDLDQTDIGKNIWTLFPEVVGSEIYQKHHEACDNNKPVHTIIKSAVSERWFDTHLYPYANGLLVYLRDVTEQKNYEAKLSRLDRLNVIGQMAASIGHEVRNPMTTVRGYLQWFAQKATFADYSKQFALMIEELDRANSIITEFLSLAKNKSVKLVASDLNTVIRDLFPLLQADAFRRGNTIELEQANIPTVFADEKEMRQCILNLVGNGLDAMPKGGKLTISTAEVKNRVILTVRDRGGAYHLRLKIK